MGVEQDRGEFAGRSKAHFYSPDPLFLDIYTTLTLLMTPNGCYDFSIFCEVWEKLL